MKTLRHKTMRSIYTLYILKRAFHPLVAKVALLVALLWSLGALVYVARVFENMPSLLEIGAFVQYMFAAFMRTEVLVQLLSAGVVYVFVWMVRDIVKAISHGHNHVHI